MSDRGGVPQNISNTPDADEFDVNWSRDGGRIVFAADRPTDDKGGHNCDIWMIDLARPEQPIQITTNASHDDCPAFDISGNAVYFRSNRGGEWGIWRISVR
jgi:Tol biopolymer transport system component